MVLKLFHMRSSHRINVKLNCLLGCAVGRRPDRTHAAGSTETRAAQGWDLKDYQSAPVRRGSGTARRRPRGQPEGISAAEVVATGVSCGQVAECSMVCVTLTGVK